VTLAARALLFVPADRDRFYAKVAELRPDAVIIDLEDAVLPAARPAARVIAAERIPTLPCPAWVRVNGVGSPDLVDDLLAVVGTPGLAGVMVPKVDGGDAILDLDEALTDAEVASGRPAGSTPVIPMIESARGVVQAFGTASASPRVVSLCFGGARGGDLHGDLGSAWSIDGPELLHARQQVLLAARAAGLRWPLDGVFADVADAEGFVRDTELSRRLGYRGRPVIHPSQVRPAQAGYAPTERELDDARAVLAEADEAELRGEGTVLVGGRLVDAAMVRHARAVLGLGSGIDDPSS
jgi:citrate lyase subunit beta/citryl-CoA lyase